MRSELFRNDILNQVSFSNRSGSHKNCFRYFHNNSELHENTKFDVFKKLRKLGYDVWTEAIFTRNRGRCDLLAIKDTQAYVIEIVNSEKEKSILEKSKKYPGELELLIIKTKGFDINKFEL